LKKKLLLIFVLIANYSGAQTNIYHPFPESNAFWSEISWWNTDPYLPCTVTDNYFVFFNGDTLIGQNNYHKVYQSGYISASCPPPGYYYYNQYEGALRQDSILKKVFFVQPSNNFEELLYDFNLGIGDTLDSSFNSFADFNFISNIDSVLVGSNFHKRFILSSQFDTNYAAIIEGVGSTLGLFKNLVNPNFIMYAGSHLKCFNHYADNYPDTSACVFTIGIDETKQDPNFFSIYPNPIISESTINFNHWIPNAELSLYDLHGRLVRRLNIEQSSEVKFIRGDLPDGLYSLVSISKGEIHSIIIVLASK